MQATKKESFSLSQNRAKKGYNPGPVENDSLRVSILRMFTYVNDVNVL